MNKSNFTRKIDELGRVVIPIEIRKALEINERDSLEIFLENGGIFIKKSEPSCVFCNTNINLRLFCDKNVCKSCIEKLK